MQGVDTLSNCDSVEMSLASDHDPVWTLATYGGGFLGSIFALAIGIIFWRYSAYLVPAWCPSGITAEIVRGTLGVVSIFILAACLQVVCTLLLSPVMFVLVRFITWDFGLEERGLSSS